MGSKFKCQKKKYIFRHLAIPKVDISIEWPKFKNLNVKTKLTALQRKIDGIGDQNGHRE